MSHTTTPQRPSTTVSLIAAVLTLCSLVCPAGTPSYHSEVEKLLQTLGASGCTFQRNGTWYTASEAVAHLSKKLEYLESQGALKSTEQFIELGASTSSMSGKPYRVKCGASNAIESASWLRDQLNTLRARHELLK